ncbi:MAG TPA: metalloregulator ArsR/SmtB family transcription factor [Thermoanaerobaculia bacterium]|nr:metalloregulator ArsR/SmtB family transcription factor [Thermoanaerobaculia bacterium]
MVNYSAALDTTFSALADPTRRAILAQLAEFPEASVSDLARPFAMSLPAISKHVRVLEGAGLLSRRKQGRVHHCRLVGAPLESANRWIDRYRRFWGQKLDALEHYLSESEVQEGKTASSPQRKSRRPSRSRGSTRRRRR